VRSETNRGSTVVPPAIDPWILAYDGFDAAQESLREALCTLGNGLFATRGATEEASADEIHYPGTYVAGGYNRLASEVAGRSVINEDLVNFPNWLPITFRPDGADWVRPDTVEIVSWRQELHLRHGVLIRNARVRDSRGRVTRIAAKRIVSMDSPHLAAIDYSVTPENWSGVIRIRSELDASVTNTGVKRYRQLANTHLLVEQAAPVAPEGVYVLVETNRSRLHVAEAARTRVYLDTKPADVERRIIREREDRIGEELMIELASGQTATVEKVVSIYSSRDRGTAEPDTEAKFAVSHAPGFKDLLHQHILAWQALWRRFDIEIETTGEQLSSAREQLILRLHVFHLLQTISTHSVGLDVGAPARGLHGEAYRGHVFWDELFIFPFYNYRAPVITRSLLLYRYYRLDAARELARSVRYRGAMFPWQSSSDGREATQELHLNPLSGTWGPDHTRLQRHVNAAIAYNIWGYYTATGDRSFLLDYGAELMLEIAMFWSSITRWNPGRERFEIIGVMGPDEYHEKYPDTDIGGLRNNAYTNVMAVWCLLRTLDLLQEIGQSRRAELLVRLHIGESELRRWEDISNRMFVPFQDNEIISQFEGYEDLEEFDWAKYRSKYSNIERLDRILKSEDDTPDRYKVSKQADVLMLFYLFQREDITALLGRLGYAWNDEMMHRNISYYLRRTSHGSTLSKMVTASVMHDVDHEEGCRLFLETLRSDIDDIQRGTTPEGVHLGAMAGTVAIVLHRYGGVSLGDWGVEFRPALPERITRIRFRLYWRGRWLDVDLTSERIRITPDSDLDAAVPLAVNGNWHELQPGTVLEVACPGAANTSTRTDP